MIPYTDAPGVEHKYSLSLYSDYEHVFEKINPRLNCEFCGNPSAIYRREGRGSSYGAGVKVGIVRFEYTANSTGRADWYALFGERF